ncbi:unnamed protein product, partial [Polarella glacialis]
MDNGAQADLERQALDTYVKDQKVEDTVEEMMQALLEAKPANPTEWLLNKLEQDISNESEELSETDLHKLFSISRRITAEIIPQDTISMVISETLVLLNCDTVSLFVLDKKMDLLRLYASNLQTPIMVSPGQGIAGSVFNSRELVNIPDCYQDGNFDRSFDAKTGYFTKSLIAVPIVDYDGASAGVIQAINKQPHGSLQGQDSADKRAVGRNAIAFTRQDEKMVAHLCQHVAIAMRNADVYRE